MGWKLGNWGWGLGWKLGRVRVQGKETGLTRRAEGIEKEQIRLRGNGNQGQARAKQALTRKLVMA